MYTRLVAWSEQLPYSLLTPMLHPLERSFAMLQVSGLSRKELPKPMYGQTYRVPSGRHHAGAAGWLVLQDAQCDLVRPMMGYNA